MALGAAEAAVAWDEGAEWRVPLSAEFVRSLDEAAGRATDAEGLRDYLRLACGQGLVDAVDAWAGGKAGEAELLAAADAVARQVARAWREAREERAERYLRGGHGHLV